MKPQYIEDLEKIFKEVTKNEEKFEKRNCDVMQIINKILQIYNIVN